MQYNSVVQIIVCAALVKVSDANIIRSNDATDTVLIIYAFSLFEDATIVIFARSGKTIRRNDVVCLLHSWCYKIIPTIIFGDIFLHMLLQVFQNVCLDSQLTRDACAASLVTKIIEA